MPSFKRKLMASPADERTMKSIENNVLCFIFVLLRLDFYQEGKVLICRPRGAADKSGVKVAKKPGETLPRAPVRHASQN